MTTWNANSGRSSDCGRIMVLSVIVSIPNWNNMSLRTAWDAVPVNARIGGGPSAPAHTRRSTAPKLRYAVRKS